MNTSLHRGSAKIYQFPVRVRPTSGARQEEDINAPRISEAAGGSGWYHEAAIQDSKPADEH